MGNIIPNVINQIGSSTTELMLVDYPTVDDILSNEVLKSRGKLKQEVNKTRS